MIELSSEQIAHYRRHGFLVVPDLLTGDEVQAFVDHEASGNAQVGLGLRAHVEDPMRGYVARHPNVAGVAGQLLGAAPCIVQSMYLAKYAGRSPEDAQGISLHQDQRYLPTEPATLMACWVALSDTDPGNGGLCVVPGSHRDPLHDTHQAASPEHRSWRKNYEMRDPDGREWIQEMYSFEVDDVDSLDIRRLTVPRGSGVFFTGMTVHGSYANKSADRDRLAFAVHYVSEGTWVYRCDVQDTVSAGEYSERLQ